ncbi:cell division protein ZipA C-terminal FtsZ-binding domain-containing protein [Methyloversatilis universalis]|uniref:cell division protein ZipA C-terminal FtsZ-binding domain-containing protein n=1 Tax=Methyloversatilis universalis TaxID=378211 RepID=UPI00035D935A|nr:cell division protein ZipA C-terminal FtsZ-binding domain-containing protein [Methyloversatilis universalis]
MQLTELQMGLIALGVLGVGAVIGYNMWQERRHRRTAERALGDAQPDVLIDPLAAPVRRVEPTLDIDLGSSFGAGPDDAALTEPTVPAAADDTVVMPPPVRETPASAVPAADDGAGWCDERIEEQVVIEFENPVAATEFSAAWQDLTRAVDAALRLRGHDAQAGRWLVLTPDTAGMLGRVELAVQLADRRGPFSDASLSALAHALQAVADRFLAVVHFPDARQMLGRARELDQFAASVDVQIGLNLVAGDHAISGTKLRGLAEAQGFVLEGGQFHARDDAGVTHYTLVNQDAAQFAPETMKSLQTPGVTLLLDVPTVPDGARAFDRMVMVAEQLAHALGARVVDDNRQPLSPASLGVIRGKIAEFQTRMTQFGVAAGSPSSRRLFS